MNALFKTNFAQFLWSASEKNEKEAKGVKNTGFYLKQISKNEYSEKYEIIVKICASTWKLPDNITKSVLIPLFGTERAYCGLFAFRGGGKIKFSEDAWNIRNGMKRAISPTPPPSKEIENYLKEKYGEKEMPVLSTPPLSLSLSLSLSPPPAYI